jgi:spore germination cell wall hydrolase CwlJ-like protein
MIKIGAIAALICSSPLALAGGEFTYDQEVNCLAKNIYHEARGQGYIGKKAVADVTINRVISSRFPNTVCGVVRQGHMKPSWKTGKPTPIKNKCQFSWYCDGKDDTMKNVAAWKDSLNVAHRAYFYRIEANVDDDTVDGAMWYHATRVTPYWASSMNKVTQIRKHIFYK